MSMRDELMNMVEAAGKATPGPWGIDAEGREIAYVGRFEIVSLSCPYSRKGDENDSDFIALCSPERIKALAEVALAAQVIASQRNGPYLMDDMDAVMAAEGELKRALERLRKAVGT